MPNSNPITPNNTTATPMSDPQIAAHRALADHLFQGLRQGANAKMMTLDLADDIAGELAWWLINTAGQGPNAFSILVPPTQGPGQVQANPVVQP
jgi:hypothetical protein